MRRTILICCTWGILSLTGCGDSHESQVANAIAILKDIADELSTIKDSASAEAAQPRLKELGGRWRANERRVAEHQRPTKRQMAALEKKYGAQLEAAMKRYFAEVARVQRVDGGPAALHELGEVKGKSHLHKR
jgi:hypothetical protein